MGEKRSGTPGVKDAAVYLYCFARSAGARRVSAVGIDGRNRVSALEEGGVAAVVSRVSPTEFAAASGDDHLADPAWVIPRAYQHERVIEEVMRRSPVLPARFGTVFSSRRALATLLAHRAAEVAAFLAGIADKEEWAVKGFVDLERAGTSLLSTDPFFRGCSQRLPKSPGARYLQEKRLRADAAAQAKLWCRTVAEQVEAELKSQALDMRPVRLQTRSVSGKAGEMVFNCAFLLARSRVAHFRARLERVGSVHAEHGLALELSGPWPPYNFCPSLGEPPA